jgi:mono/diheme cytochrome c family protein
MTSRLLPLLLAAVALAQTPAAPDRKAMYEKDIKPLMERSCVSCHGGKDAQGKVRVRGGYRADSIASLEKGGKEQGAGITWGKPMESSLYLLAKANRTDDLAMPPRKSKAQPLTAAELETLRRWIETSK